MTSGIGRIVGDSEVWREPLGKAIAVMHDALPHPRDHDDATGFGRPSGTATPVIRYPRVPLPFTMGYSPAFPSGTLRDPSGNFVIRLKSDPQFFRADPSDSRQDDSALLERLCVPTSQNRDMGTQFLCTGKDTLTTAAVLQVGGRWRRGPARGGWRRRSCRRCWTGGVSRFLR